jgi:hypothetical protein
MRVHADSADIGVRQARAVGLATFGSHLSAPIMDTYVHNVKCYVKIADIGSFPNSMCTQSFDLICPVGSPRGDGLPQGEPPTPVFSGIGQKTHRRDG